MLVLRDKRCVSTLNVSDPDVIPKKVWSEEVDVKGILESLECWA